MSITVKQLISPKVMENVQTTQYTADNATAIIDKFTVSNTTANNISFSINLVSSGDTPVAANLIIPSRTLAPDEVYPCPEIIGQYLQPGDYISTLAGTALSLTIMCSGREII